MDASSRPATPSWRIASNVKGTIACARRQERLPNAGATLERDNALYDRLARLGDAPFTASQRQGFLDTFFATPSGREKPGRFWRMDFEALQPALAQLDAGNGAIDVQNPHDG